MERDVGLGILCAMSGINQDWFRVYSSFFVTYYNTEEDEMDMARCTISGGDTDLIQKVYNSYLNLYGVKNGNLNPEARPERFVEYAQTLDKPPGEIEDIVQAITKTYKSFEKFIRRRR